MGPAVGQEPYGATPGIHPPPADTPTGGTEGSEEIDVRCRPSHCWTDALATTCVERRALHVPDRRAAVPAHRPPTPRASSSRPSTTRARARSARPSSTRTPTPERTRSRSRSRAPARRPSRPRRRLPAITEQVSIDATTQPGRPRATPGRRRCSSVSKGSAPGPDTSGLTVSGGTGTVIKGFIFRRFNGDGISLFAPASGTTVTCNAIGTTPDANGDGSATSALASRSGARIPQRRRPRRSPATSS